MLDTCIIVSAIKSRDSASFVIVDSAGRRNTYFQIVLSNALVSEYEDVIGRPEHRTPKWRDSDLHALMDSLLVPAHWAETNFSYRPLLQDPGDEMVLEAAINGQAAAIVTFNRKDFKPAERFGIHIVTPSELLNGLIAEGFVYAEE